MKLQVLTLGWLPAALLALAGAAPRPALAQEGGDKKPEAASGDAKKDADAKAGRFRNVMRELGARREQAVAMGDGANDLKMMGEAGYSIAFRAKPHVRAQAGCAIDWSGLDAAVNLFE